MLMKKRLPSVSYVPVSIWTCFPRLIALCFAFSLINEFSFGQQQLLGDLNTQPQQGYIPYTDLKSNTARIFFAKGRDLYLSEGFPSTTLLVRRFNTLGRITMVANIAYFAASDGTTGSELWKSDGTAAGTVRIKDIYAGEGGSEPQNILMHSLSLIYFTAYTPAYGRELWRTDGTEAGTVMVRDIMRIKGNSNPSNLTKVGSLLYFTANDGQHGIELWKTYGTEISTVLVKDIQEGPSGSSNPRHLTNVNGTLFFAAMHPGMGIELWKRPALVQVQL
jgi:ELWxxDGT repeat protein